MREIDTDIKCLSGPAGFVYNLKSNRSVKSHKQSDVERGKKQ